METPSSPSVTDLPVYTVLTIAGGLAITFPESGPPVYNGSDNAKACFADALCRTSGGNGSTPTMDGLTAHYLYNYCRRKSLDIAVYIPVSVQVEMIAKECDI